MIITISGLAGSGKSTLARILLEKLGAERVYVGGIFREMARERRMSLKELMKLAESEPAIDVETDKKACGLAREMEKNGKIVILEGRVQFFLVPESVKVFVTASEKVRAERIFKDLSDKKAANDRNEGVVVKDLDEMMKENAMREEQNAVRYKKIYGIDHRDVSQFDLVVDTTDLSPDGAAEKVLYFLGR